MPPFFEVFVSSPNPTYQWQEKATPNTTPIWVPITNNAIASRYTIPTPVIDKHDYEYRVVVTNTGDNCQVTSPAAKLTVKAPYFQSPLPSPAKGCLHTSYTYYSNLYASAADFRAGTLPALGDFEYQWQYAPNPSNPQSPAQPPTPPIASAFNDILVTANASAQSRDYVIPSISPADDGWYRVAVKDVRRNGTGCVIYSNASKFEESRVIIVDHPENQSICNTPLKPFKVKANSANVTYKWYKVAVPTPEVLPLDPVPQTPIAPSTHNLISNGVVSSGDFSELILPIPPTEGYYRVLVEHSTVSTCFQYSDIVKFKQNTPPTVTIARAPAPPNAPPVSLNACEGSPYTYKVTVTPSGTLVTRQLMSMQYPSVPPALPAPPPPAPAYTYKWKQNSAEIAGATGETYIINPTVSHTGVQYSAEVTLWETVTKETSPGNAVTELRPTACKVTVNAMPLDVKPKPRIGAHPTPQDVCHYAPATFTASGIAAGGGAITYRWKQKTLAGVTTDVTPRLGGDTFISSSSVLPPATDGRDRYQYYAEITEDFGTNLFCTVKTDSVTLTLHALPMLGDITFNPPNFGASPPLQPIVCEGTGKKFTARGGTSSDRYEWEETLPGRTPSALGTSSDLDLISPPTPLIDQTKYKVTVTNGNNCKASKEVTLTVKPLPVVGPLSLVVPAGGRTEPCEGEPGWGFTVTPSGGTPSYIYEWRKEGTGAFRANIAPTSPTATSNGNTGITITPLPNVAATTAATLDFINLKSDAIGNYSLKVTDAAGCEAISPLKGFNVHALPVVRPLIPPSRFCSADPLVLAAQTSPNVQLQWQELIPPATSPAGFMDIAVPNSANGYSGNRTANKDTLKLPSQAGLANRQYRLKLRNSVGCEVFSNEITISPVNTSPNPPTITSPVACQGVGATLSVTQTTGYTYQWKQETATLIVPAPAAPNADRWSRVKIYEPAVPAATAYELRFPGRFQLPTLPPDPNVRVLYTVTVTDGNGCTATSPPSALIVNAPPPPITIRQVIPGNPVPPEICAGMQAIFEVTNPPSGVSYQWEEAPPATTPMFVPILLSSNRTAKDPRLELPAAFTATNAHNGHQHRLEVTNSSGCKAVSNELTLKVNPLPTLTPLQPQDVCEGTSADATFSVTAADGTPKTSPPGAPYKYEWEKTTVTPIPLPAGSPAGTLPQFDVQTVSIPGNDSHELKQGPPLVAPTDGSTTAYKVTVTDAKGCAVTSAPAGLRVKPTPAFVSGAPGNQTVCEKGSVTFSMSELAGQGASLQWQQALSVAPTVFADTLAATVPSIPATPANPANPPAVSTTLQLNSVSHGKNGSKYRVKLTKDGCSSYSDEATLTVNLVPVLRGLANQSICHGDPAPVTFSVMASGGNPRTGTGLGVPYSYQWQVVSRPAYPLPGAPQGPPQYPVPSAIPAGTTTSATEATLTLRNLSPGDDGNTYVVTVTDALCSVTSDPSPVLTVRALPSVAGITFTDQFACSADPATFTPTFTPAQPTGTSLQWQEITPAGISTDISGETGNSLRVYPASGKDGYRYRVKVINAYGCSNAVPDASAARLTVYNPPAIQSFTSSPAAVCQTGTGTVRYEVTATGTGTLSYEWEQDPKTGTYATVLPFSAASTFDMSSVTAAQSGYQTRVRVRGSNPNPSAGTPVAVCETLSPSLTLTFTPPPIADVLPQNSTICHGEQAHLEITNSNHVQGTFYKWTVAAPATISGASPYDGTSPDPTLSLGRILQTLTSSDIHDGAVIYTITPSANGCDGTPITATVTVRPNPNVRAVPNPLTLCSSGRLNVALSSSTPGVQYKWSVNSTHNVTGWQDQRTPVNGPAITHDLHSASTEDESVVYTITPSISNCEGTPFRTNAVILQSPVRIDIHPQGEVLCPDSSVELKVDAKGSPQLTYQWMRDGVDIAQATNSTYTAAFTAADDGKKFRVRVENPCSSQLSNEAVLKAKILPGGSTIGITPPDPEYLVPVEFTYQGPKDRNASYEWNFGDNTPLSTYESPAHIYTDLGGHTVSLTVITEGGCRHSLSADLNVTGHVHNPYTGDIAAKQKGIEYYPVPLEDKLIVKSEKRMLSVVISSILGSRLLYSSRNSADAVLDTSKFPSGTYILSVETEEGVSHFKVVK